MKELIRSNRRAAERDLLHSPQRHLFSAQFYGQYRITLPLIQRFARGNLIDLGCGEMPFRETILNQVSAYDGLDLVPRTSPVRYIADVQDMFMIGAMSYDTALCLELLEHVADPLRALQETRRILRSGGVLILSVPHLSRLHDEPNDYYRFTHHGVRALLIRAGFRVLVLEKRGGLFSFLGHQVSVAVLGIVWHVPVVKNIVWFLNSWLSRICFGADQILDRAGFFAMGYSAVAERIDT